MRLLIEWAASLDDVTFWVESDEFLPAYVHHDLLVLGKVQMTLLVGAVLPNKVND